VSLKELKDKILLLAKQMAELKAAMSQREEMVQEAQKIHWGVFQAQRPSLELEES